MKVLIAIGLLIFGLMPAGLGGDFDLGQWGTLSMEVPAGWSVTRKEVTLGGVQDVTLILEAPSGVKAKCIIEHYTAKPVTLNPAHARKTMAAATRELVSKKVEIKDFSLKTGYGAYGIFAVTDIALKKTEWEDFRFVGRGLVEFNTLHNAGITLLMNDPGGPECKAMVRVVNSLRLSEGKPK